MRLFNTKHPRFRLSVEKAEGETVFSVYRDSQIYQMQFIWYTYPPQTLRTGCRIARHLCSAYFVANSFCYGLLFGEAALLCSIWPMFTSFSGQYLYSVMIVQNLPADFKVQASKTARLSGSKQVGFVLFSQTVTRKFRHWCEAIKKHPDWDNEQGGEEIVIPIECRCLYKKQTAVSYGF